MSASTWMARVWSRWHDGANRASERQPLGRRVCGAPAPAVTEPKPRLRCYVRRPSAAPQQSGWFPTSAGLEVMHGRSFAVNPELRLGPSHAAF
jgi:hypothetical protein